MCCESFATRRCAVIFVVAWALILGSFTAPRGGDRARIIDDSSLVKIVTFNIRYSDAVEADSNNNWPLRLPRVQTLVNKMSPWLLGLQEALAPQIADLKLVLPQYAAVGYEPRGYSTLSLAAPERRLDFHTCILYDTSRLTLMDQDHIWLSETPRITGSKSWGSRGARTLTMAAFRSSGSAHVDVVMFNTHLDVWSTSARHGQAELMRQTMLTWSAKFPNASVFATGDFNSANGQKPYRILMGNFQDSWTACVQDVSCSSDAYGSTFHGWLGTLPNTYGMRVLQFLLFTLHGSGIEFPSLTRVPNSLREFFRMSRGVLYQLPEVIRFGFDTPSDISRLHVDWILFRGGTPRSVFVADVRDANFSSDHFPVVASFSLR